VTGSEFHQAFGRAGWTWDGAVAQLRASLQRHDGNIDSRHIEGRDEFAYRLSLPPEPDTKKALAPMLDRSSRQIGERAARVRRPNPTRVDRGLGVGESCRALKAGMW
jgi:hypothetical protein